MSTKPASDSGKPMPGGPAPVAHKAFAPEEVCLANKSPEPIQPNRPLSDQGSQFLGKMLLVVDARGQCLAIEANPQTSLRIDEEQILLVHEDYW